MSNEDFLLNLPFLEQRGIRDPLERELVLDALNKNGKIYTVQDLFELFVKGGGVSKLISWGIHETYAQKLETFWKEQPIDAEFLKRLGIPYTRVEQVMQALLKNEVSTIYLLLSAFQEGPESQEVSRLKEKWMINEIFVQLLYKFWRVQNQHLQNEGLESAADAVASKSLRKEKEEQEATKNVFEEIKTFCFSRMKSIPNIDSIDDILNSPIPEFPVHLQVYRYIMLNLELNGTNLLSLEAEGLNFLRTSTKEHVGIFSDVFNALAYLNVRDQISGRSEADTHHVFDRFVRTPLTCFFPDDSFACRDSTEIANSIETRVKNTRPDFCFYLKNLLIFRGEEKKDGSPLPLQELEDKMMNWNPATLGRLPFIFGYAATGSLIQLAVLYPSYPNLVVRCKPIGQKLQLTRTRECLLLVKYMVNLCSILQCLLKEIPENVPRLGVPVHRQSGEYSEVVINVDHVHKKLKAGFDHIYKWNDPGGLKELYELVSSNQIVNTVKLASFHPDSKHRSVEIDGDIIHLRLAPLGYHEEPRDVLEVKAMLLDIVTALKSMHINGWVHRDLKMANIIRRIDGKWMLIDLDLACKMDELKRAPWPFWAREGYPMPKQKLYWTPQEDLAQLGICLTKLKIYSQNRNEMNEYLQILYNSSSAEEALLKLVNV